MFTALAGLTIHIVITAAEVVTIVAGTAAALNASHSHP
jgi:hypothetical protein